MDGDQIGEPLDRFVTRRSGLTWAEARTAIHRGRVTVDGRRCNRYHHPLAAGERVALDGGDLVPGPDHGVLLCHKPAGLACSHQVEHAPLLYDHVPEAYRHPDLQAAGRLDRDTTGLIILTIDGHLIQRLTEPRRHLAKRYELAYRGDLAHDAVERVANGLQLPDDPKACRPAELVLVGPGRAALTLHEGRHHQVKRMIAVLGGRVIALHRSTIGGLHLSADDPVGTVRPLGQAELERLTGEPWHAGLPRNPADRGNGASCLPYPLA